MIIVLDKSGSMGGPDFAFTKEAARAPLQLLADTDRFGLVAFDSEFFWAVPLANAENRAQMGQAISAIVPGGETDIYPALEAAYAHVANDSSEIKHVIVLSDGHTGRDPFQSLVERMAQARTGRAGHICHSRRKRDFPSSSLALSGSGGPAALYGGCVPAAYQVAVDVDGFIPTPR